MQEGKCFRGKTRILSFRGWEKFRTGRAKRKSEGGGVGRKIQQRISRQDGGEERRGRKGRNREAKDRYETGEQCKETTTEPAKLGPAYGSSEALTSATRTVTVTDRQPQASSTAQKGEIDVRLQRGQ